MFARVLRAFSFDGCRVHRVVAGETGLRIAGIGGPGTRGQTAASLWTFLAGQRRLGTGGRSARAKRRVMARIDLSRRAEIGRARRERTRSALLSAAKRVFSELPVEQVNVDDIAAAAGVAKGTFYYHFRDFDALVSVIGEELATEFDELVQPQRSLLENPLERFAWGQFAFLTKAETQPHWGRLVRHARFTEDSAAASVRRHLATDLEDARRAGALTTFETAFALRLVLAMSLQFLDEFDEPPQNRPAVREMVAAILRALGVGAAEAAAITARVSPGALPGVAPHPTKGRSGPRTEIQPGD